MNLHIFLILLKIVRFATNLNHILTSLKMKCISIFLGFHIDMYVIKFYLSA